jgi:glyoxylase-like metal-dependent hydrolase (beta-lactamase superfamily II)
MSDEYPSPDVPVDSMAPDALRESLEAGDPLTILDVRSTSEYETWHVDGENVTVTNVPYFEFIEGVTDELLSRVPEGDPLVVVCAKGGASEYVAGVLTEQGYDAVNLADGMNGWAMVYAASEVTRAPGPATVVQYRRPSSGCLSYLVVEGEAAAVVDPLAAFTDRYVADARDHGADLRYAVDTHVHADHISGVRELVREAGATGVLPAPSVERGVEYDVDYETVADGDHLAVGDAALRAIHTPGHTSGMTSYLVDDGVLLTGDGLFTESVARPDLEKGDEGAPDAARQLYETLQERVLALPDDTLVAPGHYSDAATPADDGTYTARLGALADSMDALSMDREAFVEFILADMPPRPSNHEDIIATNLGQHEPDEEEAFELELGPNNCAATQTAMTGD